MTKQTPETIAAARIYDATPRFLPEAAGIVGQAGGAEAAIVAQFVVTLAVRAGFNGTGEAFAPREAGRLLRLRLTDTVR